MLLRNILAPEINTPLSLIGGTYCNEEPKQKAKPHHVTWIWTEACTNIAFSFTLFQERVDWMSAHDKCAAMGGVLAQPSWHQKNKFLTMKLKEIQAGPTWIGVRRNLKCESMTNKAWTFTDGSIVGFDGWSPGRHISFPV